MTLKVTLANRTFDKKLLLLGYEVPDLIALLLILSVLNFVFGEGFKFLFVWLPTITVAIVLRVGKRGKPDNYIIHLLKFHLSPGVYSAYLSPKNSPRPPSLSKLRGHI